MSDISKKLNVSKKTILASYLPISYLTTVTIVIYTVPKVTVLNMINKDQLIKFKQLYFKKYGIELSDEQATEQATSLLNLMKILTKPTKINKEISQLGEIK